MSTTPNDTALSSSPPSSPTATEQPVHDTEVMCRYPSKKCWNPRALKRNGERHNLCDFHRQKANKNQRRLELKRKARAQASSDLEPVADKRLRTHKKPRQRARRAPLSAHVAMKEEALAKQRAQEAALSSWFLQDLVLLDGVYDRAGFQGKTEEQQPTATASLMPSMELQRLSDAVVDDEALDRILSQDAQRDVSKNLDGLEVLAALPEGKTSPVDVGESWDHLDFSDSWLIPMPADQPPASFDASAFAVDEDVFVADV